MKNPERGKIVKTVTRALEIPFEVLPSVAKITISGNLSLTVDGHRGIMDYDDSIVKIALANQVLLICGRGLEITSISSELATVEGFITRIEYIVR